MTRLGVPKNDLCTIGVRKGQPLLKLEVDLEVEPEVMVEAEVEVGYLSARWCIL